MYRRLLLVSLVLGIAGAGIALAYSGFTLGAIGLLYGDVTTGLWSGQWWWIPLVAAGALVVAVLRAVWDVPEKVPGGVAQAKSGWVEPSNAFQLVLISAVSLAVGASLGPSFGVIVGGGGLGAWFANRDPGLGTEAKQDYSMTGMAGSLGAVFSAPLFGAVLVGELSPTAKKHYVAAFIPQFLAAVVGYVIYFAITGYLLWGSFKLPDYESEPIHLLYAVLLGLFAVVIVFVFVGIGKVVGRLADLVSNAYAKAVVAGALVGFIAFAIPLTATGGSTQLAYETEHASSLGVGLLTAAILAKMVAVALSQEAGFLGGQVFPMLFIGGTAGILVNAVFPDVPVALAVAAMIAAVPGATISAPVSFTLFGVLSVASGAGVIAPIAIATVVANLGFSAVRLFVADDERA